MSHRTSRTIDVILALWLLLWCAIGYSLGRTVNELSGLSDGVIGAGEGVSDAAGGARGLRRRAPIGGGIEEIADRIDAIGQGTVQKGEASKDAIFNMSLLIGLVIALGPTRPAARRVARDPDARSPRAPAYRQGDRRRRPRARGLPGAARRDALPPTPASPR